MSSKLWRNVALAGVAAAGAAVWAVAPRTFNDKRRNFVPSIPEVWYAPVSYTHLTLPTIA